MADDDDDPTRPEHTGEFGISRRRLGRGRHCGGGDEHCEN
jgi:hypothetical protein